MKIERKNMDLNTYHSKSQSLAKRRPYKAVFLLPITPDSDYREEVDMLFPTFAEYPILCKKPYRKSNNTVRCSRSDNLLLVPFCLRGTVPDESVSAPLRHKKVEDYEKHREK